MRPSFMLIVVLSVFCFGIISISHAAQPGTQPSGIPSLYIVGDSTAANNKSPTIQGWGTPFITYFDTSKLNVVNAARGGRSSRTYIGEGLLDQLTAKVKPGDIVLLQWGHNDPYPINDNNGRGSLFGLGEETQDVVRPTTNKPETVHTFGWYMRQQIAAIQAKGAIPIVLTLTVRDRWINGKIERDPSQTDLKKDERPKEPTRYSVWSEEIAKAAHLPVLDVHSMIADRYDREGTDIVSTYFNSAGDPTHRNPKGAAVDAEIVLACLKAYEGSSFDQYLNDRGKSVAPADVKYIINNTANTAPTTAVSSHD